MKMTEPTWYILYDGSSVDGRGNSDFYKRTTDKQEAIEHWEKCRNDPYFTGKVVAYTDTKEISVYFDYDWEGL
jgi:hypothetical protein